MSESGWTHVNRLVMRILAGLVSPGDSDPIFASSDRRLDALLELICGASLPDFRFGDGTVSKNAKHTLSTWLGSRRGMQSIQTGKLYGFLRLCFKQLHLGNVAGDLAKLLVRSEVQNCVKSVHGDKHEQKIAEWRRRLSTASCPESSAIPSEATALRTGTTSQHKKLASQSEPLQSYLRGVRSRYDALQSFSLTRTVVRSCSYRQCTLLQPREPEETCDELGHRTSRKERDSTINLEPQGVLERQLLSFDQAPRLCVLGDAGTGKTTLLEHIAWRIAQTAIDTPAHTPSRVPCLMQLPTWVPGKHKTFAELASDRLAALSKLDDAHRYMDLVVDLLENGRAVFLLDGFDEVPARRRTALTEWLLDQISGDTLRRCPVLLASRPRAIEQTNLRPPAFEQLSITDFSAADVRYYVQRYFAHDPPRAARLVQNLAHTSPPMRRLARTPLILALLCLLHERGRPTFPRNEGHLIAAVLHDLLKRRMPQIRRALGAQEGPREAVLLRLLSCLAWKIWDEQLGLGTSADNALRIAVDAARKDVILKRELRGTSLSELLETLAQNTEILLNTDGTYQFLEMTYLEYLAGRWLADQKAEMVAREFCAHAWDPGWSRVFTFLAATLWDGNRDQQMLMRRLVSWLLAEHEAGHDDRWASLACLVPFSVTQFCLF